MLVIRIDEETESNMTLGPSQETEMIHVSSQNELVVQ